MRDSETTNGRLGEAIAIVRELIQWADADYDHSMESHAPNQARDDFRRGTLLRTALALLDECRR